MVLPYYVVLPYERTKINHLGHSQITVQLLPLYKSYLLIFKPFN